MEIHLVNKVVVEVLEDLEQQQINLLMVVQVFLYLLVQVGPQLLMEVIQYLVIL